MTKRETRNQPRRSSHVTWREWAMQNTPVDYLTAVTPLAKIAAGMVALALIFVFFCVTGTSPISLTLSTAIGYAIRWIFHK